MGEIFKQSAKGSIYIYIGVLLGFVITGVLYPRLLTPEEIGLINVLIAYSTIIAKLGGLGMQQVITRMFPYFRDEKNKHHGFLLLTLLVSAAGFLLVVIAYFFLKDILLDMGGERSGLFTHYVDMIIPLVLFSMLFGVFDNYYKVLYNAVKGTFYQEVVKRIFVLGAILAYYFSVYEFQGFILAYVLIAAVPFLGLAFSLKNSGKFYLKPDFGYMDKKLRREISDVALFGILAGASGIIVLQIDRIMVYNITNDLGQTGVYSIAFFFGSLVQKPAKALTKISSVFVSEAWKNNRLGEIKDLYTKSAVNQILIGLILLIGLVVNLGNIFQFLPKEYAGGEWIVVLVGLAYLVDMGAGINGQIINNSKYYRWQTYLILALVVMVVVSNLIFIPIYGILGAAIATLVSKTLFNFTKFIFIWVKWRMQPFNNSVIKILLMGAVALAAGWFLPTMNNYIIDMIVRSTITAATYGLGALLLRPSEDVDYWLKKLFKKHF